ncbi:MAG: ATP-grasp domain-containing protein [Leptospiraceae bacterium]|nr:ATP-grasp domain-containing protein [Leptospiraceae bacterium]MCP5503459.1 ATP-grasp domain-containing protein [Leptospiraceae bacterium]
MKSLRIAVSGLNASDNPGPGVPVLRSLKESKDEIHLIGLAYDVLEPGNFMEDLIESSYVIPYPRSGPELLLERIKYIHSKERLDMIFPTLDSELDNYISIQNELKQLGIRTFLPGKEQLHMRDKSVLKENLEEAGIALPKTLVLQDAAGIHQAMTELTFPILVKGIFYEAYLARTIEEAIGFFYHLAAKWGIPVILQECIIGEECNVAAIAKKGKTIGSVCMKKMFLTDKGKAWAGVSIRNEEVLQVSENILKYIQWDGGCELEYIIEEKTGKVFLLEINPRFPAWIYLATAAGQNLPLMQVKLAMGEELRKQEEYRVGTVFVRHSRDEIIPLSSLDSLSTKAEISYRSKE